MKVANRAMGLKAIADNIGVTYDREIQINAEARAATRVGTRLGTRKVTHIEVHQLWLHDAVHAGKTRLQKVRTKDHLEDALDINAESQVLV